jgi:NtrC-family two-component system response regulator AlgB
MRRAELLRLAVRFDRDPFKLSRMDFLVIDDDKTFRDAACALIEDAGHYGESASSGQLGLARLDEDKFDAVLLDLNLGVEKGFEILLQIQKANPQMSVAMITAHAGIKAAVEAMRHGSIDFLEKPLNREMFLALVARLERIRQLGQRIQVLEAEVRTSKTQSPGFRFDFSTPVMRQLMETVRRAASSPASILILGESGTGKSVVARRIHDESDVADKPFVTVSCPSLSKELLESDLFGHVKGSFTGAIRDHWGKVKAASGGTLFLDEIADLPLEIQPKMLRLLQEREYERIGENTTQKAQVRVIAATNRDLKRRVAEGTFREDLYFRLNVIAVEMPPLRLREADLLNFAKHYASHFVRECGRKFENIDPAAIAMLVGYSWPGNLRELRNVIERAVILSRSESIMPSDLPLELRQSGSNSDIQDPNLGAGSRITIGKLEELHIRRILQQTSSIAEAANILGIDQATLYRHRLKMSGPEGLLDKRSGQVDVSPSAA